MAAVEFRHVSRAERERIQAEARARAAYPYADDFAASMARSMEQAKQPRGLRGFLRWARRTYAQEPPFRVHVRAIDPDGTPAWSGEFGDWVEGITTSATLRRDHEDDCAGGRDCTCYYRWPLRAALFDMHGRFEDTDGARMADWCLAVASSDAPLDALARDYLHVPPSLTWTVQGFTYDALWRLWSRYSPMPRAL